MTGFSTPRVYLEDAAGDFTHDVSEFCRLTSGPGIIRGRNDEQTDVTSGEVTLRLDNRDGEFTLGSPMYDGITIDKRLRYVETFDGVDYIRFTGYVQEWPTQWESGLANLAYANITVIDRQARLARRKLLALPAQELLSDSPWALYQLDEPAGSTTAGDTSGNGLLPALTPEATTAPVFGVQAGTPPNDFLGMTLDGTNYMHMAYADSTASAGSIVCIFQTSTTPTVDTLLVRLGAEGNAISVDIAGPAGQLVVVANAGAVNSGVNVCDGAVHVVVLTLDSGGTLTGYLDGVSFGTAPVATGFHLGDVWLGWTPGVNSKFNGLLARIAVYTQALSAARVATINAAISDGFSTDAADQRIARLAGYAGITTADQNLEPGQQASIAIQDTDGVYALDAMRAVVQAEGGLLFISGDGKLTMQNKAHRVIKATGSPALTLTADQIDPTSVVITGDKNYLYNTGTGSRTNGAQQRVVNAASVTKYEEYAVQRDVALLPTDELLLYQLQWITTMYGDPSARISSLTIDLLTLPTATVAAALSLVLGDLVRLSSLPTQSPAASLDLLVEGFKESITDQSWSLTLNTVPAPLFYAPIVDTASATVDTGYPVYF